MISFHIWLCHSISFSIQIFFKESHFIQFFIFTTLFFHSFSKSLLKIYVKYIRLEWPKSGTLTTPNASEDMQSQKLSFINGRNSEWFSLWWKAVSLAVSYKLEHTFTKPSSIFPTLYLSKGI